VCVCVCVCVCVYPGFEAQCFMPINRIFIQNFKEGTTENTAINLRYQNTLIKITISFYSYLHQVYNPRII